LKHLSLVFENSTLVDTFPRLYSVAFFTYLFYLSFIYWTEIQFASTTDMLKETLERCVRGEKGATMILGSVGVGGGKLGWVRGENEGIWGSNWIAMGQLAGWG
jgi:hypothetical protein